MNRTLSRSWIVFIALLLIAVAAPLLYFLNKSDCENYKAQSAPPIPALNWQDTGLISLWFDDNWLSQYENAFPLMEKAGFKGALAVAVAFVCKPEFMNWRQIARLQEQGWEITSHSMTHQCDTDYYTPEKTKYELVESKKILMAHGLKIENFAMPCGYSYQDFLTFEDEAPRPVIEIAKENYHSFRTGRAVPENSIPVTTPFDLRSVIVRNSTTLDEIEKRIDLAKQTKTWLILSFHQIDDSGQFLAITPARLEEILNLVKASNLPVVLPTQALGIKRSS